MDTLKALAAWIAIIGFIIFVPGLSNSSNEGVEEVEASETSSVSCETETIAYETVYEETYELYVGDSETTTYGQDGEREVCIDEQTGETVSDDITVEPIDEVISEGVAEEPDYNGATGVCEDGTETYSVGRGTCSWHGGVAYYY